MAEKKKDLTGKIFGKLLVLNDTGNRTSNKTVIWNCYCECGNNKEVPSSELIRGNTKSCGCLMFESTTLLILNDQKIQCLGCNEIRNWDEFNFKNKRPQGPCKICLKIKNKNYQEEHKEEIKIKQKEYDEVHKEERKIYNKKYREENKEKITLNKKEYYEKNKKDINEKGKIYRANNRDRINKQNRERWEKDFIFKLRGIISKTINAALKRTGNSKRGGSILNYLPFTIEELKVHLESLFKSGMTWDNYGEAWHIDHKIAQSKLPYNSMTDENFKKCWSLENLHPMWAEDNLRKGNKSLEEYEKLKSLELDKK